MKKTLFSFHSGSLTWDLFDTHSAILSFSHTASCADAAMPKWPEIPSKNWLKIPELLLSAKVEVLLLQQQQQQHKLGATFPPMSPPQPSVFLFTS